MWNDFSTVFPDTFRSAGDAMLTGDITHDAFIIDMADTMRFSPDRTTIFWEADFDANGASDEDATKVIRDIFMAGLKGIKQKMLPPDGEGESEPE